MCAPARKWPGRRTWQRRASRYLLNVRGADDDWRCRVLRKFRMPCTLGSGFLFLVDNVVRPEDLDSSLGPAVTPHARDHHADRQVAAVRPDGILSIRPTR